MAKPQVTIPLDIPDVRVLGTEITPSGDVVITVESTKSEIRCSKCGKFIRKFHGRDSWVSIRYLPVFGRPTYRGTVRNGISVRNAKGNRQRPR